RQEMESLSEHLANTYEELSLIYQISSGMKINRRPADFFQQTCLELLNVLSLQGTGVALAHDNSSGLEPTLYGALAIPKVDLRRLADELCEMLIERKSSLLINDLTVDP